MAGMDDCACKGKRLRPSIIYFTLLEGGLE